MKISCIIEWIQIFYCSVENIVGVIPSAAEGGVEESVFNRFLHFAMLCIASVEMTYGLFNRAIFYDTEAQYRLSENRVYPG